MDDLLVLCYHGVSETWPEDTAVRPGELRRAVRAFVRAGYRGATLAEALSGPVEGKVLVVTFDDANRSVGDLAAPILDELGVPGTVFVPTVYAGTETPMGWDGFDRWLGTEHEDELLCMAWERLRELAAAGWEVGSHTRTHPRLSRIDPGALATELVDSKRECEAGLGAPCESFAYPYSDYDQRVVEAAAKAGYRYAVTVPRRAAEPHPLEWPRVGLYRGEGATHARLRAWSRRDGGSRLARFALGLRRIGR